MQGTAHEAAALLGQVTRGLQKSLVAQRLLLLLVLGATCMLIGDGCLTPSISVVSSISGLKQISSIGNGAAFSASCCSLCWQLLTQRLSNCYCSRSAFILTCIVLEECLACVPRCSEQRDSGRFTSWMTAVAYTVPH